MSHQTGKQALDADASLTLVREVIYKVILKESTFAEQMAAGHVTVEGNANALVELFSLMDSFEFWFNIIEPKSKL